MEIYFGSTITVCLLGLCYGVTPDTDPRRKEVVLMIFLILGLLLSAAGLKDCKKESTDLKTLQKQLVEAGLATFTPVVTESRFQLLPVAERNHDGT